MRVPKTWVPILAKKITRNLIDKKMVVVEVPEEKLLAKVEEFIMDELLVEDRLNDEVRAILSKHSSDIEQGRMDFRKLFELTKQRLVKERNIVL
ncbi:MAG: DUF507 family protein [Nitrospirae bacterium]|nr:DUF507 family protein [Nitrospirota bacterium]